VLGRADEVIEYQKIVAMHEFLIDAVDGSSTGTRVPRMWAPFGLPTEPLAGHHEVETSSASTTGNPPDANEQWCLASRSPTHRTP
jgi:hypothetical protein